VALLSDHAYLERKAASNALELFNRWPSPEDDSRPWVTALASIARDETRHMEIVLRHLHRRGGTLARLHRNPYAGNLHALVRRGQGRREIADRLMISSLIEARSCERFARLAEAAPPDLAALYQSLEASEQGHFRLFRDMARLFLPPDEFEARWAELGEREAVIIQAQEPGPRMHSGAPRSAP
jgi:tRNA-(ms[2]io[6]A)-hydroxylase